MVACSNFALMVPAKSDFKNEFQETRVCLYCSWLLLPFNKTKNKQWAGTLCFQPGLDVKASSVRRYLLDKSWHFEHLNKSCTSVALRTTNPPQSFSTNTHKLCLLIMVKSNYCQALNAQGDSVKTVLAFHCNNFFTLPGVICTKGIM